MLLYYDVARRFSEMTKRNERAENEAMRNREFQPDIFPTATVSENSGKNSQINRFKKKARR